MLLRGAIAISALLGFAAVSMPAKAMTGIGCPDLPLYYRAVGTIENGPGSCGLTMEEAKRILARGENGQGPDPAAAPAPAPRKHHRHHRTHHE